MSGGRLHVDPDRGRVGQLGVHDGRVQTLSAQVPAQQGQVTFLTHTAPYTFHQISTGTLVWELGAVPTTTASSPITFRLSAQVAPTASGVLVNVVTAKTPWRMDVFRMAPSS